MEKNQKIYTAKLLLVQFLTLVIYGMFAIFSVRTNFGLSSKLQPNVSMAIYIPFFLIIAGALGFLLFVEYKYKRLKFKNFIVYLAIAVAFLNLLSTLIIPSNFNLPFGAKLTLDFNKKLFSILIGFGTAALLILYFYLIPKIFNSKKFVKYIYIILIAFVLITILGSFILEAKTYINMIKSGFTSDESVQSFVGHKNAFGELLFIGITSTIFVSILSHNYKWLIAAIPMILVLPFTMCKIAFVLTALLVVTFIVYQVIKFAKSGKDNLYITLICSAFVLAIGVALIVFTINSGSGLLFKIKNAINDIFTKASGTFKSRMEIWRCVFLLLTPLQIVFGCGATIFNEALHITYVYDPSRGEDASVIWNAHNGFVEVLGEGGILLVIINILLLVIVVRSLTKIYKKHKELSFFYIVLLILFLMFSVVEPVSLTGFDSSHLFAITLFIPVMSIYYFTCDANSIKANKEIIDYSKAIKMNENDSFFNKLNKNFIKYNAKCIKENN